MRWLMVRKEPKKVLKVDFPPSFSTRVDMSKVQMEAMKPWITAEVTKYLGFDDEVVIGYIEGQLQETPVDPKTMQVNLTGFLEKHTSSFMSDLWNLLLSAQANPTGIPTQFLNKKKEELRQKKEEQCAASSRHHAMCPHPHEQNAPTASLLASARRLRTTCADHVCAQVATRGSDEGKDC